MKNVDPEAEINDGSGKEAKSALQEINGMDDTFSTGPWEVFDAPGCERPCGLCSDAGRSPFVQALGT